MSTPETVPDVGDSWPLVGRFYADAEQTEPADPTTATLKIRDPLGGVLTPALERRSLGVYRYFWTPLVGGAHEIEWIGDGDVQSVDSTTIIVRSDLDQALATTQYIQGVLGKTGTGNPELVARLALVTSQHIMQHCDRRFLPYTGTPSARSFRVSPAATMFSVVPWDFASAQTVALVVDPAGANRALTAETDFYVAPENHPYGIADRIMLNTGLSAARPVLVRVTTTYGWPAIPPQVAEACAFWVRELVRGVSAYPQNAQFEAATEILADGTVPSHVRQLLFNFKHMAVV